MNNVHIALQVYPDEFDSAVDNRDEYSSLDGTPASLVNTTTCAQTEEEARGLCTAFTGDRQGYANTREFLDVDGKCNIFTSN